MAMNIDSVNTLFDGIKKESYKKLERNAKVQTVKKGTCLYNEHQQVDDLYILLEGTAIAYKKTNDLERRILFIHREGEIMNEEILDGQKSSSSTQCITDVRLLVISCKAFKQVYMHDEVLLNHVMEHMSFRIRRMYHMSKNATNVLRLDKKIAARLWKLAKDFGKDTSEGREIDFPLSITLLSEFVGSTRESVSRQVKVLQDAGYLVMKKKRFIICDMNRICAYAQSK